MTRARIPRPHEVAAARRDPRLLRAVSERHDTAWRTRGVCQTTDPETFFPAPLEPAGVAVTLCGRCPVSGACLAWALSVGDCHGVWGGTTARERRAMLVAWKTEVQPDEVPYYAGGEEAELVVAAGDLIDFGGTPPSAPEPNLLVPAQRRADIVLENLGAGLSPGEAPTALDQTLLLTREPARAA